jgi:hypothetical protein
VSVLARKLTSAALAGDVGDLEPGDRVQVQCQRAEISFCQQATTIEVRRYRTIG